MDAMQNSPREVTRAGRRPVLGIWRDALRDSDLDGTAKLVGFIIATFFDRNLIAYPSKATIAEGASLGKGRRAVDHAVDRLEAAGYFNVTRSKGRTSNIYRGTLPTAHPGAGLLEEPTAHETTSNSAPNASQLRTPVRMNAQNAQNAARIRAVSPNGDGANAQENPPEDDCHGCSKRRALVDEHGLYCAACLEEKAAA